MTEIDLHSTYEWFSESQAAEYLDLTTNTLARLRRTGQGPAYAKSCRRARYLLADLNRWLLKGGSR